MSSEVGNDPGVQSTLKLKICLASTQRSACCECEAPAGIRAQRIAAIQIVTTPEGNHIDTDVCSTPAECLEENLLATPPAYARQTANHNVGHRDQMSIS